MEIQSKDISNISDTTNKPKIYSHRAIWGFSIFFSPIFGSILLMQNLKAIDRKKDANKILTISIIYTIITYIVVNIPEKSISSLTMAFNFAGGFVLSEYYFKLHFPNPEIYSKKKIWKPLIISIIITIPFILALIYSLDE